MNNDKTYIKTIIENEGLEFLGITDTNTDTNIINIFEHWISQYLYLDLKYLLKHLNIKKNIKAVLNEAKSIIIIGLNHYCGDTLNTIYNASIPTIAQYARFIDYHYILKQKCNIIIQKLKSKYPNLKAKVCVDTAPILEKFLATKTGTGFIGKNSLFIHYEKGSFINLAEIITNLDLNYDRANNLKLSQCMKQCETCKLCIQFCPFGAINDNFTINPSKCLSYWSIEAKQMIPEYIWKGFKYYYFGCDICQLICPWNKKAIPTTRSQLNSNPKDLEKLIYIDKNQFKNYYANSVLSKLKYELFLRNILIALYETKNKNIKNIANKFIGHDSQILQKTARMILNHL